MKKRDRVFLSLLLIIIGFSGWLFYRTHYGFVVTTARSPQYKCTIRELAGLSPFVDQLWRVGTGNKVYLCEVRDRFGVVSSFGFRFAGSYLARWDNCKITIQEIRSGSDSNLDGHVEFYIDGYRTRCDFRSGDFAQWKEF